MSEDEGAAYEGEYEGGRPVGLYALVGVIVLLVAVSGMFAIGYIPPVAKLGSHTTSTSSRSGSIQFVTVTSTLPGPTTTTTLPATTITNSTTITKTSISASTSTSTQTSTKTITSTSVSTSTSTASTTIYTATTSTSTTITTTSTTITTTTVGPQGPLVISVRMNPPAVPATLYPGESFILNVTVQNTLPSVLANLNAYQLAPGNTPLVTSFFPNLPESLTPLVGVSYYTISGTINQDAPVGTYEVDVVMAANSPVNNTQMSVTKQFLINIHEPLNFTGFKFIHPNGQFNGTCSSVPISGVQTPTWVYNCKINAAPMVNGTIDFNVTNSANVPICIQTSFGSGSMQGFVDMNPYPFCPDGAPGVYVPAGAISYTFIYTIENGSIAGAQTSYFTFQRLAT